MALPDFLADLYPDAVILAERMTEAAAEMFKKHLSPLQDVIVETGEAGAIAFVPDKAVANALFEKAALAKRGLAEIDAYPPPYDPTGIVAHGLAINDLPKVYDTLGHRESLTPHLKGDRYELHTKDLALHTRIMQEQAARSEGEAIVGGVAYDIREGKTPLNLSPAPLQPEKPAPEPLATETKTPLAGSRQFLAKLLGKGTPLGDAAASVPSGRAR